MQKPIDSNILIRFFHLHYFIHIYRALTCRNIFDIFCLPRFQLFREIKVNKRINLYTDNHLFLNLLSTYRRQVIVGGIITIIGASLNLLLPKLIKDFIQFMNEQKITIRQLRNADQFFYKFILIQILRLFFAEHAKRLFNQLAIKVQSSMVKKLIQKSLNLAKQQRDKIPQSQIILLQNVDLKLTFTMFKNIFLIFEVPFTIIIALTMLFYQNKRYGFIAIYWFIIAFLLQRQLDGHMTQCNQTKLGLIQKRSAINYELLLKMKQAKIIGNERLIIQKNNDLFIQQNHDHQLFYRYSTLYDITLLLLPILVVSTIALYDINQNPPITVEQVYAILALLGTCYMPMKSTRTISISFHDGLLRLKRLQQFLSLPEQKEQQYYYNQNKRQQQIFVIITQNTAAYHPQNSDYTVKNTYHIQLKKGERLNIFSRKHHGSTSFIQMIVGGFKKVDGEIIINGKLAYKPQKSFFIKGTIEDNIKFYNDKITSQKALQIYNQLGLNQDITNSDGIFTMMDDINKFTSSMLQKISFARTLISQADIFIFDGLLDKIDNDTCLKVQEILRYKQIQENKIIITALQSSDFIQEKDKILILNNFQTEQYGTLLEFKNKNQQKSSIKEYFKSKVHAEAINDALSEPRNKQQKLLKAFDNITKTKKDTFSRKYQSTFNEKIKTNQNLSLNKYVGHYLIQNSKKNEQDQKKFAKYVKKFFKSIRFSETIYIMIIIFSAQILHIFIHVFIGHLSEGQMDDGYHNYKNLLLLQIILTICLAGIIYLQGQVSSYIAIIIGNKLYAQALTNLTKKRIDWFANQYSVKIADRFNHDYEEIFIAVHGILGIYKNIIIFMATIQFIHTNRNNIILIMTLVAIIYFIVFHIIRKVQKRVIKHYYDYKYGFVRVLQQSIRGSNLFKTFNVKQKVLERAQLKYTHLASYKLAQSYSVIAISILSDVISTILLGSAINYGIEMRQDKVNSRHIAVLATAVTLLINLESVLKIIIKQILNFGSFFSINILPFLQIEELDQQNNKIIVKKKKKKQYQVKTNQNIQNFKTSFFELQFQNVKFDQNSQVQVFNFVIKEGQRVLIYENNDQSRNILIYSLTGNYPLLNQKNSSSEKQGNIIIGGYDLRQLDKKKLKNFIGVIEQKTFFFSESLRQSISEGKLFNQSKAIQYANMINLDVDLGEQFIKKGLQTQIVYSNDRLHPFIQKKIAILRILINQPKIIIIKDTTQFIGPQSIIQLFDSIYQIKPTIIKLSKSLSQSYHMNRIIKIDKLKIIKDISKDRLMEQQSQFGDQLRNFNMNGYIYQNKSQKSSVKINKKFQTKFMSQKLKIKYFGVNSGLGFKNN